MKACPHCQNTIGFVFGTCCQCGWNYLENRFKFVTVWYPEANGVDPELIAIHAQRTYRAPAAPDAQGALAEK